VLQFAAEYCSVLQCVALCCSMLQCAAVCCRLLQIVAVCYSTHLESLLTLLTKCKEAQIMLRLQLVAYNVHLEINPKRNYIRYVVRLRRSYVTW